MINFKQIYEGFRNRYLPKEELKETIEKVRTERLDICKDCPFNSSKGDINAISYCKSCGCNLEAKTSCLSCKCPKDKWLDIVSKEEEFEISQSLNKEQNEEN